MNRTYRLVWNPEQQRYVPAPETAKGRHKQGGGLRQALGAVVSASAALVLLGGSAGAYALPTGGQIGSGTGSVTQNGSTLTVGQSSQKLALNWQSFGIDKGETVNFVQPNASAIALNRVLGSDASAIYGKLNANGQVYLINPNGILFGKGAEVNVGGLVASTLNLSDSDFRSGRRSFSGNSSASVINQGDIQADGGYIALLGSKISNQGTLQARLGAVALAAGEKITLDFAGDKLINIQVDQGTLNALAENRQLIQADGGTVVLTAQGAGQLVAGVVNNSGVIRAQTLQNRAGVIALLGDMLHGEVDVGGTLDASAPNGGNGGFIETSAAKVNVAADGVVTTAAAQGKTGRWLIDPHDYTVAASGGDISGATLSSNLATTNVTLQSSSGAGAGAGNVNVNDPVSWSANTTLTLTASNHVNVNAPITANGSSAGLAINPNSANGSEAASGTGSFNLGNGATINLPNVSPASTTALVIGGVPYTVINSVGIVSDTTAGSLQGMQNNLGGHYALGSNIDASATAGWNGGAGFAPVGTAGSTFGGVFDGLGHTISGLVINAPAASSYIGLFGYLDTTARVQNVGMLGTSLYGHGGGFIGQLAGYSAGSIRNAYAEGSVVGGVGSNTVGGLVGENDGGIANAHAAGTVRDGSAVAGLVGVNFGSIGSSYSTVAVTSSTGYYVAGLVGQNSGNLTDVYVAGSVTGAGYVGGVVGRNFLSGSVTRAYAVADVSGNSNVGAFAGSNSGTFASGYWNKDKQAAGVGSGSTAGVVGLTTAQSRTAASYTGFSFTTTPSALRWVLVDADGTLNNAAGASGLTTPMLASEYATTIGNAHQLQLMAMNTAANYSLSANVDAGATSTNKDVWGAKGFAPVGNTTNAFTGSFDGHGRIISGLTINNSALNNVGLFGVVGVGGSVTNVGLVSGSIGGGMYVGAIAGTNAGQIANVFASNAVTGTSIVGGVIGANLGSLTAAYSQGSVGGTNFVGGLVGSNDGSIDRAYAAASVAGGLATGGLVALNGAGTVTNSFWNTSSSGQMTSDGGIGLTSAQMQQVANFTTATLDNGSVNPGWDFSNTWVMYEGHTAPLLRSFMTPLTVTANNASKTYDGQAYGAFGVRYSITPGSNLMGSVAYGGSAAGAKSAGSYSIDPSGLYSNQQGYIISYASGTLTIIPAPLTVSGTVVGNKTYDGSVAAALSGGTLNGVVAGDVVGLNQSGTFASKNVGNAIAVVANDFLSGAAAGNYTLIQPLGLSANITAKPVTVLGTVVTNKTYDGRTNATLSGGTLSGVVAGDLVTLAQAGAFVSKNVGNAIVVTAADSLGGTSAGNYSVVQPTGLSGNITPKQLSVGGATLAATKTYDGATTAMVSGGIINSAEIIAGDTVAFAQSGSFADKNVGTAKVVGYSNTLSGADAGNYSLSVTGGVARGDITAKVISVGNTVAMDKMYDGNTNVTFGAAASLNGVVDGDAVRVVQTGKFADKNVATYQSVFYNNALTGADAGNYSLSSTGSIVYANILARPLTVTSTQVLNKVYDGTTKAVLSGGVLNGVIAGDKVTLIQSGTFASKNAGTNIAVKATDSLGGASAGNYSLAQPLNLSGNITPKNVTVMGTKAMDKVYDSTTAATLSGGKINGLVAGDIVLLAQSGAFVDKNVGKNKTVIFNNHLTGSDAANYSLKTLNGHVKAKITPFVLQVDDSGVSAMSKVYDGTTAATIYDATIDTSVIFPGDKVGLVQTGSFTSRGIGVDKLVNYRFSLMGADAGNYGLDIKGGQTTADITAP